MGDERENASLLETVTRKVNEKIKAERELAEAQNHVAELELERARFVAELDASNEELGKVIMACPQGMRRSPASEGVKLLRAERDRLAAEVERKDDREAAAREFVIRHPALSLIDLAEFNAYLKLTDTIAARASLQHGEKQG